jgi:hypothetical protein
LTLEELQAELDALPCQDADFQVGFLMAQVVWLVNQIEEMKNEKTTRSKLEMATSIKT